MTNPRRYIALWTALVLVLPLLAYANGKGQWVRKESSGPAPGFSLTDQDNRKVSLGDFRGKVVAVTENSPSMNGSRSRYPSRFSSSTCDRSLIITLGSKS